ncbi:MAG: prepilin-type N-terminal cleavage/methylation domain-containing protein [Clostridiales bacterium]|jgi:type II secretory pathway pseudopilin PulG|nr:prepilin-type N-terminal cleavage/methylation domain-containing protein [Clostridiales bacterium]
MLILKMNKLSNNKGMTLTEIVVAFVLFMIIVTFFAYFFVTSMRWTAKSNKDTTTVAVARLFTDTAMVSEVDDYGTFGKNLIITNSDFKATDRMVETKIIWRKDENVYTPTKRTLQNTTVWAGMDSNQEILPNDGGGYTKGRGVAFRVFLIP